MLPGEYMSVPGEAVQPDGGEDWVALDPVAHVLNDVEQEAGEVAHEEDQHDADQDDCEAAVGAAVPVRRRKTRLKKLHDILM